MTDNVIKLNKNDVIRLEIVTNEGEKTGEYLEFDLEDLDLPLRYQDLIEKDKKNKEYLRNQITIIEKRQDVKGKKIYSKNEEDTLRALKDFFKKEAEIYNMFLGENGVQKLLNGRKLGWTTLQEIDEIIDKQIMSHLNFSMENITNKIKSTYGQAIKQDKEIEVIE